MSTDEDFAQINELLAFDFGTGTLALKAHQTLGISVREVERLAESAREVFERVPKLATDSPVGEQFRSALKTLQLLAALAGRRDFAAALLAGLIAIEDRHRGFDEPIFRARPSSDHREPVLMLHLRVRLKT
jgi:hypothetical protein